LQDFIQNIQSDNLASDVSHHFPEVVALYRMIGGRSDIDICTSTKNDFSFSLLMENDEAAESLHNVASNNFYEVYDEVFMFKAKREKNSCVNIRFKRITM